MCGSILVLYAIRHIIENSFDFSVFKFLFQIVFLYPIFHFYTTHINLINKKKTSTDNVFDLIPQLFFFIIISFY